MTDDQILIVIFSFTKRLIHIRNRHVDVVETMGRGILEMKDNSPEISKTMVNQTQYFLDRFYLMRISIRMLINQHSKYPRDERGWGALVSEP